MCFDSSGQKSDLPRDLIFAEGDDVIHGYFLPSSSRDMVSAANLRPQHSTLFNVVSGLT